MSVRRSLGVIFLLSNSLTVLMFGVTVVLARLLSPSEIGVFSIVAVIAGVASILRDFGVSAYLQRERDLTAEKREAALTFLIVVAWSTAIVFAALAQPIARFYGEPGMASLVWVFCLSFAMLPFASYPYALLAREMRVDEQAAVSVASQIAFAVCAIGLAYLGHGYMSLAWANVANTAVSVLGYLTLSSVRYPRRLSLSKWGGLVRFGGGAMSGMLLDKLNQAAPDMILGKIGTTHDVGLFSRANGLVSLFIQAVGPSVNYNALPFLSRESHEGRAIGPLLCRGLAIICCVGWPVYFFLALYARQIIEILYGAAWVEAAPVASVLALGFAFRLMLIFAWPALSAAGKPFIAGQGAAVDLALRLVAIWLVGSTELWHFAAAIAMADILSTAFPLWQLRRHLGLSLGELMNSMVQTGKLAVVPCAMLLFARFGLPDSLPTILQLVVGIFVLLVGWILGVRLVQHAIRPELSRFALGLPSPRVRRVIDWVACTAPSQRRP